MSSKQLGLVSAANLPGKIEREWAKRPLAERQTDHRLPVAFLIVSVDVRGARKIKAKDRLKGA